jgi:regulator of protease activity HflC (stomatin/prohibitin superfamily)
VSNPSSNASRTQLKKARPIVAGCAIAITIFVCIIAISLIWVGLVIIGPEERGVVISALDPKGYRSALLQPGPHWIIPLLEHAQVYSIAPQTYTMAANMNFGYPSVSIMGWTPTVYNSV